jgi:hypothetical protein
MIQAFTVVVAGMTFLLCIYATATAIPRLTRSDLPTPRSRWLRLGLPGAAAVANTGLLIFWLQSDERGIQMLCLAALFAAASAVGWLKADVRRRH